MESTSLRYELVVSTSLPLVLSRRRNWVRPSGPSISRLAVAIGHVAADEYLLFIGYYWPVGRDKAGEYDTIGPTPNR